MMYLTNCITQLPRPCQSYQILRARWARNENVQNESLACFHCRIRFFGHDLYNGTIVPTNVVPSLTTHTHIHTRPHAHTKHIIHERDYLQPFSFWHASFLTMTTCFLLDGNPNADCQLKRSNRQCLICPGRMDLVEVSQTVNLFWIPICSLATLDLLDCPGCGYSTSVESYEYLRGCHQKGTMTDDLKWYGGASTSCHSCKTKLAKHWQYCPGCGSENKKEENMRTVRFEDAKMETQNPVDEKLQ
jgi:hypothetical protein